MTYVVWFYDYRPELAPCLGGKCASLGEMTRAGMPVPPGFAVTIDAQRAACAGAAEQLRSVLDALDPNDPAALAAASSELRALIESSPITDDAVHAMTEAYLELGRRCGVEDLPVAVRSSATSEDSPDASFAGEHDTFLWVCGIDDVLDAVRQCWSSLFTERAIAYRHQLGFAEENVEMAVAVQKMVRPKAAGVAFTLNPHDGDRSQIAIDASWGFGEAVVAGEVTPDNYLVDKVFYTITRRTVSDKTLEYRLTERGRGVHPAEVPPERRRMPCLNDEEIIAVARLARRAEKHYGTPQDTEWAVDSDLPEGERVLLLQSRPETVWSRKPATAVQPGTPTGYASIVSTLMSPLHAEKREARFPSPFDIETPPGAEGWEDLYSYSALFSPQRHEYEAANFWFQDGVHWPTVLTPWDATFFEFAIATLSQYNTRHYLIPPALGIDYRVLNGYGYLSPVPADPAEIEARVPHFLERAGFYFTNWNDLYDKWLVKMRTLIGQIQTVDFSPLPDKEDLTVITGGLGTGSGLRLQQSYHTLLDLCLKLWMHHFEFLNLGYAAYLDFFGFCKQAFPTIPDQAVARMVAGVEVDLFRPDDELKKLAHLAVELDLDTVFVAAERPDAVEETLNGTDAGRRWLTAWTDACEPWFNFSTGSGFYHSDKIWIEHHEVPFRFIRDYAARVRAGDDLARPLEQVRAERDRIVSEYRELLATDEDRATFEEKIGLARVVFPYVENHNFYVEHWAHSMVWRKMRELGRVLVKEGFTTDENDVFYFRRNEVPDVLWDLTSSWSVGATPRGPGYWRPELQRRKDILAALAQWSPPPALGVPPEVVTEPFTIMLWGITSGSVATWLSAGPNDDTGELIGMAASPGVAEGPARVISGPSQINEVQEGEILVAPLTAPSWAPIFGKIGATVTDVGGMMSHAAIVCREYGLPAVTGTAFGTKRIKTGQRIRVDGNTGTVTVIES